MISHRQNDVLRILTVFSVILLPLTLISGIFGMNVDFPGFDTAAAFWAIVGVMSASPRLVGFFRYKRWLVESLQLRRSNRLGPCGDSESPDP